MADKDRIELEPAGDGTRWRVRHAGADVQGHAMRSGTFVVEGEEGEDAEGHMPRVRNGFSLEPDGEDENGEPLYRIDSEGDTEGHAFRGRGFSLEPTGEEEGGDPVYRMLVEGDDAQGHAYKSGR
jgi:hypothetical protein